MSLHQMCTVEMAAGPLDNATVKLTPNQLNMKQEINFFST